MEDSTTSTLVVNVVQSWTDIANIVVYGFLAVIFAFGLFYAGQEDDEREIFKEKTKNFLDKGWTSIKNFTITNWEVGKRHLTPLWTLITTRVVLTSKRMPYFFHTSKKHFQNLKAWLKKPKK